MGVLDRILGRQSKKAANPEPAEAPQVPYVPPVGSTQQEVLDYLTGSPKGITFIHGKAGSGKTFLIRRIEKAVRTCLVLTPTNLAARLYRRGTTIHSFFYKGFDSLDEGFQNPDNITDLKVAKMEGELRAISMLIFDEISMVRADTMEMIDRLCRRALGKDIPFGGIPTVMVGDLFQLPPIVSDEAVYDYLLKEYGGIYFFNSHVIAEELDKIRLFELTKSYRQQNDPKFVELLDAFREPLSPERKVKLLEELNKRVRPDLPPDAVYIASSNQDVSRINTARLNELPGEEIALEATYRIKLRNSDSHIELKHSELPTDKDIEPIRLPTPYDGELRFKPGARVMLTKNAKAFGYSNGDFGTVVSFDGQRFTIDLDNGDTIQCPHPFDRYGRKLLTEYRYEMEYDEGKHRLVRKSPYIQATTQFPVKLAYAFTIHKSQGQTYDKVILDLTSHIFAPGQLYVALSRARSLDGLFLTKEIIYSDIITDDAVFLFLNRIRLANGAGKTGEEPPAETMPVKEWMVNPRCDDFICFVRVREQNAPIRDFLCHTLQSYKAVFALGKNDLAREELAKVIDLITGAYITDRYTGMICDMRSRRATADDCRYNLNAIFEIYTDVITAPRRQLSTDSKFMPR